MPNSVITAAGLALFARAQHEGFLVPIDKMIFADVPGLDPEQTPDPAAGLPPTGQVVFEGDVEYSGRMADDTVVYSRILSATDGDFYLNWIGLYSTEYATLVAVCVVHRHRKYATDGFHAGNTLYKNFALQFANASALTGIVIEAASWQFDLSTRYALIDHNHDDRYEPKEAVATHNTAEDPHHGKFDRAGAGIRYPDWENITALSADTTYTAAVNGWLLICLDKNDNGGKDGFMTINGQQVLVGRPARYYDATQPTMYIPICTGDTYRYDNVSGITLNRFQFIQGRD